MGIAFEFVVIADLLHRSQYRRHLMHSAPCGYLKTIRPRSLNVNRLNPNARSRNSHSRSHL
jgi:hypothetical protein